MQRRKSWAKLDYYCKNHNQLCCAFCITKIKGKGNGQHKDCDICFIEDIKEEKKNKLKENIKYLEDLNKNVEKNKNLKLIYDEIIANKEKLQKEIQNIFTKIRKAINETEDNFLLEIENLYNYCNEDIIKENEKLPNEIKISLENGKTLDKEWDNNNLVFMVNECINVEKKINNININNNKIKKFIDNKKLYHFNSFEENINNFIRKINDFGKISNFDSAILKNEEEFNKFKNLVLNSQKIANINLIYRSTKDGYNYSSIVNKINNKSNLLFLYLTGNKRIFGAYIKVKLENIEIQDDRISHIYCDKNAFAFCLNNNRIYKIIKPENVINIHKEYYILIGNTGNVNGFYGHNSHNIIHDEKLINEPKVYDFSKNFELTEGLNELNELEIFEINYYYEMFE